MPGVPYLLYRKEFMKMSDNNNNAKTMYEAVPAAAELNKVQPLYAHAARLTIGSGLQAASGKGAIERQ